MFVIWLLCESILCMDLYGFLCGLYTDFTCCVSYTILVYFHYVWGLCGSCTAYVWSLCMYFIYVCSFILCCMVLLWHPMRLIWDFLWCSILLCHYVMWYYIMLYGFSYTSRMRSLCYVLLYIICCMLCMAMICGGAFVVSSQGLCIGIILVW